MPSSSVNRVFGQLIKTSGGGGVELGYYSAPLFDTLARMLLTLILFVLGFVFLVGGADWLVRGASRLAQAVGVSPLVIGLTVVSFGTSAPELAVSVQSAYLGQPDLAIGNVVGSNICNILLILGLAALLSPLVVSQKLLRLDVPLMTGVSLLLLLLALDGRLGRIDGTLLFSGILLYVVFSIWQSRRESRQIQEEYARRFGVETEAAAAIPLWNNLLLIGGGLILLVLGAHWLVEGAVVLARWFGISELIIGLTVIAVGTSLPEIAASVVAGLRGEQDIAVGNAVGSNLFNILAVLGLTALVAPEGVRVATAALYFDIPVMIVVAFACLPIFFTGHRIARWEGALFLGYYGAYLAYLALDATGHGALDTFSGVMLWFVAPLTVITLLVSVHNAWRGR